MLQCKKQLTNGQRRAFASGDSSSVTLWLPCYSQCMYGNIVVVYEKKVRYYATHIHILTHNAPMMHISIVNFYNSAWITQDIFIRSFDKTLSTNQIPPGTRQRTQFCHFVAPHRTHSIFNRFVLSKKLSDRYSFLSSTTSSSQTRVSKYVCSVVWFCGGAEESDGSHFVRTFPYISAQHNFQNITLFRIKKVCGIIKRGRGLILLRNTLLFSTPPPLKIFFLTHKLHIPMRITLFTAENFANGFFR